MSRSTCRAAQRRPPRPGANGGAWLAGIAWLMCAALTTPPAHAGRTDSDGLAPAQRSLQIDAPVVLERLDIGPPAAAPAGGSAAMPAAIVADMRIATHAEARALLQGSSLPGGTDAGGGTATLSALLDRLSVSMPSASERTAQRSDGAGLDCALFADGVRVRRVLGASDPRKPGEMAGPASAMELDVPM